MPEFGVICVNLLLLHWPMPWFLADLITVTHFCPVYLSKILVVFKAFKIPFVKLFVDFLIFSSTNCARRSLHWLPVKQRIQFKNLLLAEFMLIGNKCHRNKFDSNFPVDILNNSFPPAAHARNLGVIIDSDLNFQRHIKNTVKVCNYFICDIRSVRKHLTLDASTAVANALVDLTVVTLYYIPFQESI